MTSPAQSPQERRPPVVSRDRRRIDPDTLQPRVPLPERDAAAEAGRPAAHPSLETLLAERTSDLQRVKAEYDNYRRRVQHERARVCETARADLVRLLLPVLDTIEEARARADLAGFEAAAHELHERLEAVGLSRFGAAGEPFDPARHEAVIATVSDEVDHPVCTQLLRPGYYLGDSLLRPADVAVAQPPNASGGHDGECTRGKGSAHKA
jgi:molecular chaperone GrpE